MITTRLAEMLTRQIASEVAAHQMYLGIAIYFRRESLDGWGALFLKQSMEEAQHAKKIIDFLVDVDVEFKLPANGGSSTRYPSALDACKAALSSEQRVSQEFQAMAAAAIEEKDFAAFQFLQWFIDEQVEEEDKMRKLIDLVQSGVNLFQAQPLLSSFE
jgi:ferritin